MTDIKTLNVKLEGDRSTITRVERLLSYLAYCSSVGHSAEVSLYIDGDGSDRLKIISGIDTYKHKEEANALSTYGGAVERIAENSAWADNNKVWTCLDGDLLKNLRIREKIIESDDIATIIEDYSKYLGPPSIYKSRDDSQYANYFWVTPGSKHLAILTVFNAGESANLRVDEGFRLELKDRKSDSCF